MHKSRSSIDARRLPVNSAWSSGPAGIPVQIHQCRRRTRFSWIDPVQRRVCVIFTAPFVHAQEVQLIGEFTGWEARPTEMDQNRSGLWFTALHLSPGDFPYAYLVDGERRIDPDAPVIQLDCGLECNRCHVAAW